MILISDIHVFVLLCWCHKQTHLHVFQQIYLLFASAMWNCKQVIRDWDIQAVDKLPENLLHIGSPRNRWFEVTVITSGFNMVVQFVQIDTTTNKSEKVKAFYCQLVLTELCFEVFYLFKGCFKYIDWYSTNHSIRSKKRRARLCHPHEPLHWVKPEWHWLCRCWLHTSLAYQLACTAPR